MPSPTTTRMIARDQKGSDATSLREITMISALRMKSVVTAPRTIFASASGPRSTTGAASSWCPETRSQTFSAPSKQR